MDADPDLPAVYATRGLVEVLLSFARDADPDSVSVALVATPAGDIDGADLPPETPVFTDFYLPGAGDSLARIFGVDLSIPPGGTGGRFLSHPTGERGVSTRDDFHARMLIAVPPWDVDSVAAYDRRGRRLPLELLDVDPPRRSVEP